MEIAYLVSEYPARSHTFIRREIYELRKRGATIHVFAIRKPTLDALICEQDWIDYNDTQSILPISPVKLLNTHFRALINRPKAYLTTLFRALKDRLPGSKNTVWALFHFAEAMYIARELEKLNVEHLHVHFANAGANIGHLASLYSQIPWSVNLHGACDFEYPAGPLLGEKLLSCKFAICASYYGRSQAYRTIHPDHWQKLIVSRCGIELNAMPVPARTDSDEVVIMSVARISTEKGLPGLIAAFSEAHKQNHNLKLVLVGDGPDRPLIEEKIRENKLQDKIVLTGNVDEQEVLELLNTADVFALASLMEGIPLALMEAMALEIPVIAPRIAGIPELIDDRVNGLLYTPGRWDEFAEKITTLAEDPKLRRSVGKKGKDKVTEEFDISIGVQPLWDKLNEQSINHEPSINHEQPINQKQSIHHEQSINQNSP
jgi:glycosyltransferase involved in cell wall biosynthesis